MSDFTNRTPCKSCPYRKDVRVGFWDKVEFKNLLAQDADELNGSIFGCHEDRKKPDEDRRLCIGWVLDQKRRNVPSIRLRLMLARQGDKGLGDLMADASDGGVALYPTLKTMCRANGVRPKKAGGL